MFPDHLKVDIYDIWHNVVIIPNPVFNCPIRVNMPIASVPFRRHVHHFCMKVAMAQVRPDCLIL